MLLSKFCSGCQIRQEKEGHEGNVFQEEEDLCRKTLFQERLLSKIRYIITAEYG